MSNWKSEVFKTKTSFDVEALYLAEFIGDETTDYDGILKVRFKYRVKDSLGKIHLINRSFNTEDATGITKWLKQHTDCDFQDPSMNGVKNAKHLVEIGEFEGTRFILNVFPLDGDLYDIA